MTLSEIANAAGGRIVLGQPERPVEGISIDTRTLERGQLFVAVSGQRFDGHEFLAEAAARGAVAAVVARDVVAPPGLELIRVADTTAALADLARHVRTSVSLPVVAITGSTGKTTTKDMTAALLASRGPVLKTEGNLNNQYGLPLTLFRLRPEHTAAVLELGMSARGELARLTRIALPDVAVITNVAPVHLAFFDSVDAIARAKAEILEGVRPGGAAVLNYDDPRLRKLGASFEGEVVWFGRDRACAVSAEHVRGTIHGIRFDLHVGGEAYDVALPLPGVHFVMNLLAAAAVALRFGVTAEKIAEIAANLEAAPHRGRVLRLRSRVTLLDDCYNSNPVAVEAAVSALQMAAPGRRVAFLGDMLELGPTAAELHRQTAARAGKQLDVLVVIGALAPAFVEGARQAGVQAQAYASAEQAAADVPELLRPGDAVLVKGSRGVHMETIVDAITRHFGLLEG
jgi:UDP-N-acetylmuramoyl-tripeptide--D-alanyl-D-alanine ligase